jgi:hypothetical protein
MTNWTDQLDYVDFTPVRAPDWNKIVRDDQKHLHEAWAFHRTLDVFQVANTGIVPANGQQDLALDFTGTHTEANGGVYRLQYGTEISTDISVNALATEVQNVMMNSMPSMNHFQGPVQALRPNITVTGSGDVNDGFSIVFLNQYFTGEILELVPIDVSLTSDGEDFDGDIVVTVVTPADDFAYIPIISRAAWDFGSPPNNTISNIGLLYPGQWWLHAMIANNGVATGKSVAIRLNGEDVAKATYEEIGAGIVKGQYDIQWEGFISADDEVGFYIDTTGNAQIQQLFEYTYFEGYYMGEAVT